MNNLSMSDVRYKAIIPDTLNLAERASLAINGLGGTIDPDISFIPFGNVYFARSTPYMEHWSSADVDCGTKILESFSLMRLMSGSTQNLDIEAGMREAFLARVQDGLFWDFVDPKRPWRNIYGDSDKRYGSGRDEDFCVPAAAARMLRTMMVWWQQDHDPDLEKKCNELIRGLRRIAIDRDDYCYYPEKGGWGEATTYPRSGWLNTDEAKEETEGYEGSITSYHGHQLYAASIWHRLTGDPLALDLARRLAVYVMRPKFWGGVPDPDRKHADAKGLGAHIAAQLPDPPYTAGAEMGHWYSHFHARAVVLRALLEYARTVHDERILEFVKRSYEFTLTQGIARTGWVNCYPAAFNLIEGCAVGDLTALGIRLTDAGAGDYWDDVDAIARNHLVEQQVTRADLLEKVVAASADILSDKEKYPGMRSSENVIPRSLGVFFATSLPTSVALPSSMVCCNGNGTQGLYYAWEGTLREHDDTAEVNLFLNRTGKLLEMESVLPYEGKVVLRNKAARRIAVRIPAWVSRRELRADISGKPAPLDWIGNRLLFSGLAPTDVITLAFPVEESTARYTVNAHTDKEQTYTCRFRSSTLMDISPRDETPTSYPLYQRNYLPSDGIPRKEVTRFEANRLVMDW